MQEAIDFLSQKDDVLMGIISDFGLPIIQKRATGYASMCHIILEQQVSIASAKAAYDKLVNLLGTVELLLMIQVSEIDLKNLRDI